MGRLISILFLIVIVVLILIAATPPKTTISESCGSAAYTDQGARIDAVACVDAAGNQTYYGPPPGQDEPAPYLPTDG